MAGLFPLASGSRGNALLFQSPTKTLLIDCGISGKALQERLEIYHLAISDIDAILISHDHTDHIAGLKAVALKYNIPIFANLETARGIASFFRENFRFKIFTTQEPFRFGDLEILPFSVLHDTGDPVAFSISLDGLKVVVCTDLGFASPMVKKCLLKTNHLYIEANHEPSMVMASARPQVYKERVLSRSGHLSNEECAELIQAIAHPELRDITLAHLSSECNNPQTAIRRVCEKIGSSIPIYVAPQEMIGKAILFS